MMQLMRPIGSGTTGGLSRETHSLSDEKTLLDLGLSRATNRDLKLTIEGAPLVVRVNLAHSLPRSKSVQVDTSVCSSSGGFNGQHDETIEIQTYSTCSVYCLKHLIWKQMPGFPTSDQVLTF